MTRRCLTKHRREHPVYISCSRDFKHTENGPFKTRKRTLSKSIWQKHMFCTQLLHPAVPRRLHTHPILRHSTIGTVPPTFESRRTEIKLQINSLSLNRNMPYFVHFIFVALANACNRKIQQIRHWDGGIDCVNTLSTRDVTTYTVKWDAIQVILPFERCHLTRTIKNRCFTRSTWKIMSKCKIKITYCLKLCTGQQCVNTNLPSWIGTAPNEWIFRVQWFLSVHVYSFEYTVFVHESIF